MSDTELTVKRTEKMVESELYQLQCDISEMLRVAFVIEGNFLRLTSHRFKEVHDLAVDFDCLAAELEASASRARFVADHLDGLICYEEDTED